MFNFGRVRELEKQVYELEHEVQRLDQQLTDLDVETENRVALDNDLKQSNVVLDWELMNAFSIERNKGDIQDLGLRAYTTVGYFVLSPEGQVNVREWHLWTTVEQHNKLVEEFNAYLVKKKKK